MYRFMKRSFDLISSFTLLVLCFPFLLIIGISIKIDSRGPILFKQKRIGVNKNIFYIYKFRTMRIDTPVNTPTHLLDNPNQWITRLGKILRKTSLDELPQLINILKGEMTVVGPRPALWNQYDLINLRDEKGINDIPPGLTGYAQINGRDEISIQKKVKLDDYYYENMSLGLDLKIILLTIAKIFTSDGIVEGKKSQSNEESK